MSKLKIDKRKRLFLAGSAGLTAASVAGFASANQMASPSGVGVLEKTPPPSASGTTRLAFRGSVAILCKHATGKTVQSA